MNKQILLNHVHTTITNSELSDEEGNKVSINKLLSAQQIYNLTLQITNTLPKSNLDKVTEFHTAFKIDKEDSYDVYSFKYAKLRFRLILEEVLELAFAFGIPSSEIYDICFELFIKNKEAGHKAGIIAVADALTDILVVTHGTFDVTNLSEIQSYCMDEVHNANMSKLIPADSPLNIIKESIQTLKNKGFNPVSKDLKNGYISIQQQDTGKIIKPITYIAPDLKRIVNNHINK